MSIRVLVVDDLPMMRAAIRKALSHDAFLIVGEAENGRDGVLAYAEKRPDVVLLDIAMPVMDGITALEKLLVVDPGAKVVMCSALGEKEMVMQALRRGAREFVVKPFTTERLVSAVSKVARSHAS
ncbi:MAG: response regulator [Spirochaetes bacterium]|jgi:two-component system chemotaxis response regulator CheY|nr:response regulator [Spirochaetota bacterium]